MDGFKCIKQLDLMRRIVLPSVLCDEAHIKKGDQISITVDGDKIIIQGIAPKCIFCGDEQNLIKYKGKLVCQKCLSEMTDKTER
ncbi:AbrB/MazE/SpoVT family DNA-binding domain-containing protein [Ruminococcus sp.]|uniref:AbrB/MazE/SpoVT family DNA-binding domain-containing protein n=1 Tax=Ruminococcus sp. TaxID=41978 RepID=UPI0025E32780|nr:AbrB/MazE/SpoVT family DNA-binding domain-containing protein [Ruminococcus sp.]